MSDVMIAENLNELRKTVIEILENRSIDLDDIAVDSVSDFCTDFVILDKDEILADADGAETAWGRTIIWAVDDLSLIIHLIILFIYYGLIIINDYPDYNPESLDLSFVGATDLTQPVVRPSLL